MPPVLPKEDVSNQFPLIPIDAKDQFDAAKQIVRQLNRFRAEGWTTGQAFAGKDGINQYHMENDTKKAILRFDLRPTIRRGVSESLSLTMNTMMAATPEITEQKIEQMERKLAGAFRLLDTIFCPRFRNYWSNHQVTDRRHGI